MQPTKNPQIGNKYLNLTVISRAPNDSYNHKKWHCKCVCGKATCVATRQLGKTESCGCVKAARQRGKNLKGVGEISGTLIVSMRGSAKRRDLEFSVSAQYLWDLFILQDKKCIYSGQILHFGEVNSKIRRGRSASLDRIDSSKGYIEGNVQWVDRRINFMKLELSHQEFLDLIKTIYNYGSLAQSS